MRFLVKPLPLILNLVFTGILFSQQDTKSLLQTDASLNFEDCTDLIIDVLDKDNMPVNHVDVTNLETDAWVYLPSVFEGRTILSEDFHRLDNDRFKISINAPNADPSSNLIAVLKTYAPGVDVETADPLDEIVDFPLVYNETTSSFESDYFLLVMDIDEYDDDIIDNESTPQPYNESDFDGEDDASDDKTIGGEIGGKLKIEYMSISGETITKIINVCEENPLEIREVRLNLISMELSEGVPFIPTDIILERIGIAQKIWQQACIRFVDQNGDAIDAGDITPYYLPDLMLEDQLVGSIFGENSQGLPNSIIPSQQQKDLLDIVKDEDPLTIDLIFVKKIIDPLNPDSEVRGESFWDYFMIDENEIYERTCFISEDQSLLSVAHELGHVLTDDSHYGFAIGQGDYFFSQFGAPGSPEANGIRRRNLMRRNTSNNLNIYESKRLLDTQIEWARTRTDLPQ